MRLSTRGRYAVMAIVDMATHGDGYPVALVEIAERQEISLSYLEQLFSRLRKNGLVNSVRGPGGGYLLAHPADKTRISDIILAVDEPIETLRCASDTTDRCRDKTETGHCLTHDLWEALGRQIHHFLSGITIEDVKQRRINEIAPIPPPFASSMTTHSNSK
ncbi:DNA-binding transcriptional dual regulator IscR [Azospirillaceae bacterium]